MTNARHEEDRLIKVDRNGTKTFASCRCQRCSGSGRVPYQVDNGICWKCGGSGLVSEYHYRVMTPEYRQKLEEKKLAKAQKDAPIRNAGFFKSHGFNADGKTWVVAGNTYEIKDELKEAGAKFAPNLGWHFDHEVSEYKCFEVSIEEVAEKTARGDWWFKNFDEVAKMRAERSAEILPKKESHSEYIGNIGDRIEVKVTFKKQFSFETKPSWYIVTNYINTFEDENENVLVWKTASWQDIEEGKTYTIKGTVKEHSEYKGTKQTILTRCKITE